MEDEKFGPSIYVVVEFAVMGDEWDILFWSTDLAMVRDWIKKNSNMDTFFEYYEVKQLLEF